MQLTRGYVLPGSVLGLILLAGAAVGTHAERGDDRTRVDIEHRTGQVRIVTVDEDGVRHEEVYDIEDGHGARGYLGVRVERPGDSDLRGAAVTHVVSGSPADKAGLREGDVIVGFDGDDVRSPGTLVRAVRSAEPGQRVDVEVLRDGRDETLIVQTGERSGHHDFDFDFDFDFGEHIGDNLGEQIGEQMERLHEHLGSLGDNLGEMRLHMDPMDHDEDDGTGPHVWHFRHGDAAGRPKLGVQLAPATPELRQHLGGPPEAGILVSRVIPGTPAEQSDVRVGDLIVGIDGHEVADHGDLRRQLRSADGQTILLDVIRDGSPLTLSVFIPAAEDERPGPRA